MLQEIETPKLYRSARVELLTEVEVEDEARSARLHRRLTKRLLGWFAEHTVALSQIGRLLDSELSLGSLCDILGFALPLPPESKQKLLEELHVERRVRRLLAQLDDCPAPPPPPSGSLTPLRKFPPDFSSN